MRALIAPKVETFISCPGCNESTHRCGHLKSGAQFGPWYCKNCGLGIKGVATSDGADIEICKDRHVKTLSLLRLFEPLSNGESVHIVVEGSVSISPGENPDFSHNDYLYNEHQCPWNYLRIPLKCGDDTDPHGVFQHQETILMPEDYDGHSFEWSDLFPSLSEAQK